MFRSIYDLDNYNMVPRVSRGADPELALWIARVAANGGTLAANSIGLAAGIIQALDAATFNAKVLWLAPLLGSNLAAALVPLRDSLNAGVMGNTGFVNGDFSQSTGLQGNGSSKVLDTMLTPYALDTTVGNGGMGYWENNIAFGGGAGDEPMGTYNNAASQRFVVDLRTTLAAYRWGAPGNGASSAGTAVNGHYYGQKNSATLRTISLNGTQLASNTSSDGTAGTTDHNINLMGAFDGTGVPTYWGGRCAVAYLTDGSMTTAEITAMHTLLTTYLITPTGR